MTDRAARDLFRDMRTPIVPVEAEDVVRARRDRTVAALRNAQLRQVAERGRAPSLRKRFLLAALVLLPSAALADTWVILEGRPALVTANSGSPSLAAAAMPLGARAPARAPAPESPGAEPAAVALASARATAKSPVSHARSGAPAQRTSSLAEENALLQAALSAGRRGDDAREITLLAEFLSRFPRSELAQNAEIERIRALHRRGEVSSAARLAARYLGEHPDGMARDEARRLAVEGQPGSSGLLP